MAALSMPYKCVRTAGNIFTSCCSPSTNEAYKLNIHRSALHSWKNAYVVMILSNFRLKKDEPEIIQMSKLL